MSILRRGREVRQDLGAVKASARGTELTQAIVKHLDDAAMIDVRFDKEIETLLAEDALGGEPDEAPCFEPGLVTFSPSYASKCERELFYKAVGVKPDPDAFYPYQRRWSRNGSAVHGAVQRDLLCVEKYQEAPLFKVRRTEKGRPAWEKNIRRVKRFEHQGVAFQLYGMMDGILIHNADGTFIGLEYKTKSTTIAAIGEYKLKAPQENHRLQQVAYSLLFELNEFLIVYESLAKDGWTKNAEAKPDLRAFYVEVGEAERIALLDKFAEVAGQIYDKRLPRPDFSKCIFCPYKSKCREDVAA